MSFALSMLEVVMVLIYFWLVAWVGMIFFLLDLYLIVCYKITY